MVIWLIIKIRVHSLPNAAYCLWYIYIFIAFLHIFIAYCSAKNGICDMYRFYRNIFIYSYCFHRTIIALHNILWKSFNYALTIKHLPTLIWKWYYRYLPINCHGVESYAKITLYLIAYATEEDDEEECLRSKTFPSNILNITRKKYTFCKNFKWYTN